MWSEWTGWPWLEGCTVLTLVTSFPPRAPHRDLDTGHLQQSTGHIHAVVIVLALKHCPTASATNSVDEKLHSVTFLGCHGDRFPSRRKHIYLKGDPKRRRSWPKNIT